MTFATAVSRLLDPMGVMAAVTILGAYGKGVGSSILLVFLMLLPPLLLRWRFAQGKGSSGWDIRQRAHRPKTIAVLLALGVVNIILAWVFGNASFAKLFVFYELWLAGFLAFSLFWKISGHAGGMTLATGLIIRWYGWAWWPVILLVPVMAWARVKTGDHTVGQVVGGALYSMSLMGIMRLMGRML